MPLFSGLNAASLLLVLGFVAVGSAPAEAQLRQAPSSLATSIAQTPTTATLLYVNSASGQDGAGRGGSSSLPLRTITYALQVASSNTVIQLAPGSYTVDSGEVFPLLIPAGVMLRGDRTTQGATTAIIGGGTYLSPTFAGQNITIRPLNNTQIAGVTITNPNTRGTAVWVESTNPVIQDNTFANSLRDGVFVTGTGNPTVSNNVFINNDGNGVSVARTAQGSIQNNVFQDTGFGIAVGDTSTPTIANNQIIGNVDGVVISNSARPLLRNNVIQNNTRDGIVAIAEARPDMGTAISPGGNVIRNNSRYDVHNATRNFTIVAVGNDVDASRMLGAIELIAAGSLSSFPDVQGHWAQAYIEAMASLDVIRGFPDGTYRPNDPVTRAQFAAIISKAFNPTPKRPVINFGDIQSGFWGQQAIDVAYRGGFMTGLPGGVFRPDERIPKVQVLVSLASGLELSTGDPAVLNQYQDAAEIPTWATAAVAAATQSNIVINYPTVTQLGPFREATRAEVAALVYQAMVQAGKAEAIESPYSVSP